MKYAVTLATLWALPCLAASPFALAAAADAPKTESQVPQNLDELWSDFPRLDRETPLEAETLKEWREGDVVCRVVRFQVGVFQAASARVAAFYAFPLGAAKLPGLLELHGGGQSASLEAVVADARRGYAALSLNWGGNKLSFGRYKMTYDGPQTDWGRLDATHPPQRNQVNHFAGPLTPDEFTLDSVASPRNSNWFVVLLAARRAVTFLSSQPEVDAARIGAYGHSMGGKLTTDLAGIEPRIRAAVPSCGGGGDVLESQTDLPGCVKRTPSAVELACISDNAYIPRITCPILWLSPTNDFNAPLSNMAWNWRNLPDERTRFSIAPHLNHHHTDAHQITQHLWFEQHLRGAFQLPRSPQLILELKTSDGVPAITVTPDLSQPVQRVDIHYATDPHELTRFWRTAEAVSDGRAWRAKCPVLSLAQPFLAFANAVYELPDRYRNVALRAGSHQTDVFALSSRVHAVHPSQLQLAGVQATAQAELLIDDGSHGWRDWYRLNWDHPPLWQAVTRKVKDAQWRGPDGARLAWELKPAADCSLTIRVNTNGWGAFEPGQPAVEHVAEKQLRGGPDWQTVTVSLSDFTPPLENWRTVTELTFTAARESAEGGRRRQVAGTAWQGPRDIRNLRWEVGGQAQSASGDGQELGALSPAPEVGPESEHATAPERGPAPENWPAWRGDGTGVAPGKPLPVSWSETENVRWRVTLPGEGNSSPVIWGRRVFLTAALHEGQKRLVLCLDADSGRTLWQTELVPEVKTVLYPKTGFAAPTPVADGQRVYVCFDEPGLAALDMDGRVVWQRRLGPFDAPYNLGSSPVLYKDLVIQCCDHHGPSFVAAFDRRTGEQRWRTPRPSSGFGHFGTPLLIAAGGRTQVVINGEPVAAYSPDTGEELWTCRGMKECVAPSPVFGHGLVYASSGRTGPVMAIDPSGRGDVTETHVRLHLTSGGPYVPTPLVYPHLLVPGDNGRLLVYSGAQQRLADERIRDHFTASPVAGDGKIYWASERGQVHVLDAARLMGDQPTAAVMAVNQLSGACLATPAIAHGRLFIRTTEALYCIGGQETSGVVRAPRRLPTTFAELKQRYEQHQAHWQNEPEAQIRLEALEALANLDDPGVVPFLLWAVQKEPHWDICEEAVKSLGRKGAPAVPSLLLLVPDSRPFVRTVAINELGRLRVAEAVPALVKALDDKQPLVRCASLQALGEIGGGRPPQLPQIVSALVARLSERAQEEAVVRQAALDGLAALGNQTAPPRDEILRALAQVAADRNPRLAKRAEEILQRVYAATPRELEQARGAKP